MGGQLFSFLSLPIIGLFPLSFIWALIFFCDFLYRLLYITCPHTNLRPPYLARSYLPLKPFFTVFIRGFSFTRTKAERGLRILAHRSCGVKISPLFVYKIPRDEGETDKIKRRI